LHVTAAEWLITLGATIAVLLFDLVIIGRRPHMPKVRNCAIALSVYVCLALIFGLWLLHIHEHKYGLQFYAGWLTEYSLSIDNTFIFMIIMSTFKVPKEYQLRALFFGVVFSLTFRGILIVMGGAALQHYIWLYYIFGTFIVYSAVKLARDAKGEPEVDNAVLRFARNRIGTANSWDGFTPCVRNGSGWVMTPMFIVMVALGATDVMFALDSIPAVYGLTREPYVVFTANAFALMGMRQLYFLLGGLLDRLVYLSKGLALVMFFLGIKLVLHALRENNVPFINGGQHLPIPKISSPLSLGIIAGTLAVTAVVSLYATRARKPAADIERV
jgi:tellurite resistance protein TerC